VEESAQMTDPEDPNAEPHPPNLFKSPPSDSGFPPPPGSGYPPPPGSGYPPPPAYPAPGGGFPSAPPVQPQYGYGQPPMAAAGMYFDPNSQLLLPNGTELASIGRRIGAFFLAVPLLIVTLGIGYIIWGLAIWGRGQTPALQVLGMRVWRPETQRTAGFGFMVLREIIGRFVDNVLYIVTGLISFILMLTVKERKSLHDLVAGTVVLYDPNRVLATK
jgi:uncharacterized RDD family membrane protein YckC